MNDWFLIASLAINLVVIAMSSFALNESHQSVMGAIEQNGRLLDMLKELYEFDQKKTEVLQKIFDIEVGAPAVPAKERQP